MSSAMTPYAKLRRPALCHNPAAGAIVIMLKSHKMHGMAQAVGELTEQGALHVAARHESHPALLSLLNSSLLINTRKMIDRQLFNLK